MIKGIGIPYTLIHSQNLRSSAPAGHQSEDQTQPGRSFRHLGLPSGVNVAKLACQATGRHEHMTIWCISQERIMPWVT